MIVGQFLKSVTCACFYNQDWESMYSSASNNLAAMALDIYELKIIYLAYQDIINKTNILDPLESISRRLHIKQNISSVNLFGFLILTFARILPFLVQEQMDRFKILREVERFKTATSHAMQVSEKYKHL